MEVIPELGHHSRGWIYVEHGRQDDRGQSYLPRAFHAMTEPERSDALPAYRAYFGEVCEPEHDLDGLSVRMVKIENPYRQAGRVSVRVDVGEAGDAIQAWGQAHINAGHFND